MKLEDILLEDNVVESINNNLNYLLKIIPELNTIMGFEHKNPNHHLDVWNHTLLALSLSEKDFDIRLTLLLHDIGKPVACVEKDGVRHFKNHQLISAAISKDILTRLGYDEAYIKYITYLVMNHDMPISRAQIENNYELSEKLFKIQTCDALAHNPEKLEKRKKYLEDTKEKLLKRNI